MATEDDQTEAIDFLRAGGAFETPGEVEVVETHGALVFLSGSEALKIKRAVRYDYMDLSTLALREEMLRRELALNAPGAPTIYRDVMPVTREADGALALGGTGMPVEWVLRMRRFPKSAELVEVAARGALDTPLAERLGREIHDWHGRCEVRHAPGATLIGDILDELGREFAGMGDALGEGRIARFDAAARADLARRADLLDLRAAAGHVRRAHGDLHLRNIVLIDGDPVLFDALEFDETLGTCDTLYDLAFLLMDLWHRDLRAQANATLGSYLLDASGDEDAGTAALPLFQAVRAAIRAMTGVQAARAQGNDETGKPRAYLDAALRFLAPEPPALVAVGGLSGTGKTGLARALAPTLGAPPGAVHLRTDTERKAMARVAAAETLDAGHYSEAARHRVYDRLAVRAATLLDAGRAAVLDATFLDAGDRATVEAMAREAGLPFTGLWLDAPADILLSRVAARRGDASDADEAVLRRQLEHVAPPSGWLRVDAAGAPDDTLSRACAALDRAETGVAPVRDR
jgi:hypothetical protein